MRLGKDLIGKPIITINDGRHVGKIKDVYLDNNLYWMVGIFIGREGLLRRKDQLIPREAVVVFGIDAVLIKNAEAVTDSKELDIKDWVKLTDLAGRDIDTPGGTKIATVGDIVLDTEGRITGFSLAKVSVDGPIAEHRAITREVIIDNGNEDGVMTIDLVKAEQQDIADKEQEEESADTPDESG